jgi:ABC-type glutathione transport system ATPase component
VTDIDADIDVVRPRGGRRVVFLDDGIIVEEGRPEAVLGAPQHPRTRDFLAMVLNPGHRVPPSGGSLTERTIS